MRRAEARVGRTLACVLCSAALLLGGCALHGLGFVEDDRVDIVSPRDREELTLPVTIEWTARDVGPNQAFAVLIDAAPPPPGHTVEWLFRDDKACALNPGCPTDDYLADRGVIVTTDQSVTITRIPTIATDGRHDFHEVTIVMLDASGERAGESAWSIEFELVGRAGA